MVAALVAMIRVVCSAVNKNEDHKICIIGAEDGSTLGG